MSDRSAIGGLDDSINKATKEVENVLSKYDWSGMDSKQRSDFTSKLYSTVQQSVGDTSEQLNQRQRESTR